MVQNGLGRLMVGLWVVMVYNFILIIFANAIFIPDDLKVSMN